MIPNEKLASDTIRNATIVSREKLAEITVQVPLSTDLGASSSSSAKSCRRARGRGVRQRRSTARDGDGARRSPTSRRAERLESELRVRAHARLRAARGLRVSPRDRAAADELARVRPPRACAERSRRDAGAATRAASSWSSCSCCAVVARRRRLRRRARRSRTAAPSTSLQPVDDRPELVRLRGRRHAARLDPGRAQPPAGRRSTRISPWLPKAAIAIEDRRFYQHGGVDWEGILRAAWRDVAPGKVVEGGSTITQQLVRNLYISRERTSSGRSRRPASRSS